MIWQGEDLCCQHRCVLEESQGGWETGRRGRGKLGVCTPGVERRFLHQGEWENCGEDGDPGSQQGLQDLLWMEELEGCWKGSGGMKADKGCVCGVVVFASS